MWSGKSPKAVENQPMVGWGEAEVACSALPLNTSRMGLLSATLVVVGVGEDEAVVGVGESNKAAASARSRWLKGEGKGGEEEERGAWEGRAAGWWWGEGRSISGSVDRTRGPELLGQAR